MTSREQFEAWLEREQGLYGEDIEWELERNCYAKFGIHLAWRAWQESRNEIENDLDKGMSDGNRLPDYTFSGHGNLEEVILPETIETIDYRAFSECSSLKSIDFSPLSHLRSIAHYAFENAGITSVDFSKTSLASIGERAFGGCSITGDLLFPATLNDIGSRAFSSAVLSSIKLKSPDKVYLNGNAFESTDKTTCKVYVPKGLKETYKADKYWSAFQNMEEFGWLVKATTTKWSRWTGRSSTRAAVLQAAASSGQRGCSPASRRWRSCGSRLQSSRKTVWPRRRRRTSSKARRTRFPQS